MTERVLIWRDAPFWLEHAERHAAHCVVVAKSDPRLIAYFTSAEKQAAGIRTPVKPGRYLTRYFSDVLTAKEIAYYAAWQSSGAQPAEADTGPAVLFAHTADEIEHVYTHGPQSCMAHDARYYDSPFHPVRVYGAGDLAIAYLADPDDPSRNIARTLCRPSHKVFGRLYPTENPDLQEALRAALVALGYQPCQLNNGMDGARMRRVSHDDDDECFVMPYLDYPAAGFDDDGEHLILRTGSAEYDADRTNGWSRDVTPEYDNTCDNCDDGFNDGGGLVYTRAHHDGGGREQFWCDHCIRYSTFRCEGFDETFRDDVAHVEIDGATYTLAWAEDNATYSDYSEEWFIGDSVSMADGDVWSADEFETDGFTCRLDGENYPRAEMHPDAPDVHQDADPADVASLTINDEAQHELALAA
jgi:hypothetical protein